MAELTLTDVDEEVLSRLRDRASRHGRTTPQEATGILADAVRGQSPTNWEAVDNIFRRLQTAGQTFSDSADLVREDRDR